MSPSARYALLVTAWLIVIPTPSQPQGIRRLDGSTISIAHADSLARQTFAAEGVTGAQLVVMDEGRVAWSAAYGMRREPDLPMTRETTTWAASITKSVFATYVMQLVERGEFDLDVPIAQQLARPLDQYEPYRETATEIVHDSLWPRVTPRMLLAHASGLHNFAFLEPDKKLHLHFAPGTGFKYSGDGINLVQFVIEQKKGMALDTLMDRALFAPLGMTHTSLIYHSDLEANVADRFDARGKFISKTRRFPARGAGSMATSAEDLARFVSALFADRIISAKSRAEMLRPFQMLTSLHQFPLATNEAEGTEGRAVGLGYGVGWGLLTRTPFGPAFFKEGHGDGAQNHMICFAQRQACMILLTNSDNGERTFRTLLEQIFGDTVTPWEWEGYTAS
ncbi:MAG: beta-lactamase family protein [Gemmatimonadota bacterium]|nr:beta-lactamase family protein [Gemmatimonadota bacterium]